MVCLVSTGVRSETSSAARQDRRSVSLQVLWTCIACAAILDALGAVEGLGFDPAFQLEAQPLFFAGLVATILLLRARVKLGPLLAGVIFWIPIIAFLAQLELTRDAIPFGGDVVGIAELAVALVGVVSAHNVYHSLHGSLIRSGPSDERGDREEGDSFEPPSGPNPLPSE